MKANTGVGHASRIIGGQYLRFFFMLFRDI
jgi:hypothetical protein